jgi:two-component system, OmpR family, sensor kinase
LSIGSRLTIAIVLVLVATIAVLGIVLVRDTRAELVQDVDDEITINAARTEHKKPAPKRSDGGREPRSPSSTPQATPLAASQTGDDENDYERTVASFCYSERGETVWEEPSGFPDDPDPPPKIPPIPSAEINRLVDDIVTLPAVDDSFDYRTLVTRRDNGDYLITASSLESVDSAIDRLVRTILIAGSFAVVAAALASWFFIKRGLRPVDHMVDTAAAIAAGDLSKRVPEGSSRTELGKLGTALNDMLGQIERSALAREASENRLRRFVADAAHELRTPLTSLRGYAELYRQGALANPDAVDNAMGRIESESLRMGRLVDDLLLLARMDQHRGLETERVDIGELVDEAVADFEAVEPERPVTYERNGAITVVGDRNRLRQVIDNLLANVRTHTPAKSPVHVAVTPNGSFVEVSVADEGPGIAPEDQEHIFERFWRADPGRSRSRGGSGLGLAIVATLVQAHGGSVAVRSSPGQGSTFTVSLPLAPAPSEAAS